MSSQLTVVVAGIVLVVAIVVALVIMRRGDSRFTYDTQHGTAPRATEGEGNTAATASRAAFPSSPRAWVRCLPHLPLSCGACRWSRPTTTTSRPRAIRPVPLPRLPCVAASWTARRALVQNRPSLAVVAYRDLADDKVLVRHLATCRHAVCRCAAQHPGQFRRRAEPAYDRD